MDKRWETSRTAIYAALNGTRLASESTLCAMVIHWDPRGADAIPEWLKIRYDVEEKIITKPVAAELSAQLPTVTASMQGDVAATPRPPRRRRNVDTAVLVQLAQNLRSAAAESGLSVTQLAVQAHPNRVERPDQSNGGLEKDDWPVLPRDIRPSLHRRRGGGTIVIEWRGCSTGLPPGLCAGLVHSLDEVLVLLSRRPYVTRNFCPHSFSPAMPIGRTLQQMTERHQVFVGLPGGHEHCPNAVQLEHGYRIRYFLALLISDREG